MRISGSGQVRSAPRYMGAGRASRGVVDAPPQQKKRVYKLSHEAWKLIAPRWGVLSLGFGLMLINRLARSEEHTSELQSHVNLVCRLLLEKKNNRNDSHYSCSYLKLYCRYFVLSSSPDRHLHSFPTRRSSDLAPLAAWWMRRRNKRSASISFRTRRGS